MLGYGWSIRTRLAVIASVVMALLLLSVSAVLIFAIQDLAEQYKTEQVAGTALKVVHTIKRGDLPQELPESLTDGLRAIQVINAQGQIVAGTENLADGPRIAVLAPPPDSTRADDFRCDLPELPGCNIIVAFRVYETDGDWLVYAIDGQVPWYVSIKLIMPLAGISALLVGLTAFGTARTVSNTLKPVHDLQVQFMELGENPATPRRIPIPSHRDELRSLTFTANAMLDRLEASMVRQRQFTSDASHDLRSPITAMRAELDEALLYPDETDWPRTAGKLDSSLDRLQAIVEDLLALARLDSGKSRPFERIELDELVCTETARRPVKAKLTIDAEPVAVEGDRLHLTRLITNLLDNAERHTDTQIYIKLYIDQNDAVLEVLDDGDGIPLDQREAVFQRFTRLDTARHKDTGGTGLGLAIVREIAIAHHGTITVEDSQKGARFVLRLPRVP